MNRALVSNFQQLGPERSIDFAFDSDLSFEPVDFAGPRFRCFAAIDAMLGGDLAMTNGDRRAALWSPQFGT